MNFLLVGLGGFAGAVLRYCFYLTERSLNPSNFPFATLTINVLGCLLSGLVLGYGEQRFAPGHTYYLVLSMGFLGAFTTFSAFSVENFALMRSGHYAQMGLNMVLNVGLGVLAVIAGRGMMLAGK